MSPIQSTGYIQHVQSSEPQGSVYGAICNHRYNLMTVAALDMIN